MNILHVRKASMISCNTTCSLYNDDDYFLRSLCLSRRIYKCGEISYDSLDYKTRRGLRYAHLQARPQPPRIRPRVCLLVVMCVPRMCPVALGDPRTLSAARCAAAPLLEPGRPRGLRTNVRRRNCAPVPRKPERSKSSPPPYSLPACLHPAMASAVTSMPPWYSSSLRATFAACSRTRRSSVCTASTLRSVVSSVEVDWHNMCVEGEVVVVVVVEVFNRARSCAASRILVSVATLLSNTTRDDSIVCSFDRRG